MLQDSSVIGREKINEENRKEQFLFFNYFLERFEQHRYQWKYFAFSLYRLRESIEKFENYRLRTFLQENYQPVLDEFLFLMKTVVRIEVEKQKILLNGEHSSDNITRNHNESAWNLDDLKKKIFNFQETLSNIDKDFSLCTIDLDRIEKLKEIIKEIQLEKKIFDGEDEKKLRIIAIEEILKKKSDKTDLNQLKNYFDDQMKHFQEKFKEFQSLKSTEVPSRKRREKKLGNQNVRPFLTFELDLIRKYQRQALIRSPDGAIPIYRRQAWAAANLLPNRSLQFVRYTQDRLADQVRRLTGFRPAETYANSGSILTMQRKFSKLKFHSLRTSRQEIDIVGKDNRLYRGQIQTCRTAPMKTTPKLNEKRMKSTFFTNEKSQSTSILLEQFDPTSRTNAEKNLFEYFDWYNEFQHRDLPDEINEKLFEHWKTIICDQHSSTSTEKQSSSECQDQSESNVSLSMEYSRLSLEEKNDENHQKVEHLLSGELQIIDQLPTWNEIASSQMNNDNETFISDSFSNEFNESSSTSIEKNRSDDLSKAKLFSKSEEFGHTTVPPIDSRLQDDSTDFRRSVLDRNHQNSSSSLMKTFD